ncbi:DUF692 domain-containing protein [Methylococcus sp. EFPC2]|uniref:HvfB family MNIO-type RiPP peptide maturase n=1 Tax=Methylococcus sp. EFPC2 TaxID=2812648 RepID=UPI001967266F|nr:DUF692 domain-containing protein [Methylococcus sp. EFPC2]QSA95976.1 DUF692 domain-containing protein [Methylococcus sp. EFPC2]
MKPGLTSIRGAGLGLRRVFAAEIVAHPPARVDFYEVAPENWMHVGGRLGKQFRALTEAHTIVCHGLSLSLGGTAALDEEFLGDLRDFLILHGIGIYSEHLSYCGDDGLLYDLMPIPFTEEAVIHTARRIRHTQEILERRIAIENISYYAAPGQEMAEIDFLNAVLQEADCDLLLDINNIHVNAVNHAYDAARFLARIPADRIVYAHIAGHYVQAPDLLVDTHGAPVIDPVWALLEQAYALHGVFPTLLERDFNIPPLADLLAEVDTIHAIQQNAMTPLRRHG